MSRVWLEIMNNLAPMATKTNKSASAGAIETNDVAPIPAGERHGKPWHLFTVWSSPNLEFATIFVGALAIIFGLNIWQGILAVIVGNALAALTHGYFSTMGPKSGLPQMILGRSAFGVIGNRIPAGTSTLVAGIGWFAVNTTSGAFALQTLSKRVVDGGIDITVCLAVIIIAQIVIAFIGHNLIQKFERYAFYYLVVVWLIVAVTIFSSPSIVWTTEFGDFNLAGFTAAAGAAYGYTAGWTPFASDYTRYLPEKSDSKALGLSAGLGNFFATTVLMVVGVLAWSILGQMSGNPTDVFVSVLDQNFAILVLLGIAIGSVSANVLNVYSGAMSFLTMGIKVGFKTRRAIMVLLAGVVGGITAYWAVANDFVAGFEGFLLVVSYWVAPWIAIVLIDYVAKGYSISAADVEEKKNSHNDAGIIAFVIATVMSISYFAYQIAFAGSIALALPVGDLTAVVGFVLAVDIYIILAIGQKPGVKGGIKLIAGVVTVIMFAWLMSMSNSSMASAAVSEFISYSLVIFIWLYLARRVAEVAGARGKSSRAFLWLGIALTPAVTGLAVALLPEKK